MRPCDSSASPRDRLAVERVGAFSCAPGGEYPCCVFPGGGSAETDGDQVPELGPCAGWLAAGGGVFCPAPSSLRDVCRSSSQPTITMLMANSATMAMAQTGNPAFGCATFTSNRAGPVCRCRSFSDFFSASRMNDIG